MGSSELREAKVEAVRAQIGEEEAAAAAAEAPAPPQPPPPPPDPLVAAPPAAPPVESEDVMAAAQRSTLLGSVLGLGTIGLLGLGRLPFRGMMIWILELRIWSMIWIV